MKEQFVTYEIALAVKELGFDEECLAYYTKDKEFISLSTKKRGELVGHGSVKNTLFKWLKENDKSHGELFTLSNSVSAPLWQQVIDWFRVNYKINIVVGYTDDNSGNFMAIHDFVNNDIDYGMIPYQSYEEAREQAILKAIELCKK